MDAEVQALCDGDDWRAAAELAESRGFLRDAESIYRDLLDYANAGRVAALRGDHLGALELYLNGGEHRAAEALRSELVATLSRISVGAIDVFARHRRFQAAAELAAALGLSDRAADLFREAQSPLEAAQCYERIGRYRDAGELYQQATIQRAGSAKAHLGMGRILQRFDDHRAAVPHLGRALASRDEAQRYEAAHRLAFSLGELRLEEAGRLVLARVGEAMGTVAAFGAAFRERWAVGTGFSERYRVRREHLGPFPEAYLATDAMTASDVWLVPLYGAQTARSEYLGAQRRISQPPIPGVGQLVDGDEDGLRYAVFTAPSGQPLVDFVSTHGMTGDRARSMASQMVKAVEAAHRRDVLHGSLNPWSISVGSGLVIQIVGFDLARMGSRAETVTALGSDTPLAYLAPEAAFGAAPDFRVDFYGVGAILWRLATGRAPRPGDAVSDELSDAWRERFACLLAVEPEDRPNSHEALRRLLESADWSTFPSRESRGAVEVADEREARYRPVESQQPAPDTNLTLLDDVWLGRRIVRYSQSSGLSADHRDRAQAFARASSIALQPVLGLSAPNGSVDFASLSGDCLASESGMASASLEDFLAIAEGVAELHHLGVCLGGFSAADVWRSAGDGRATLELASKLDRVGLGPAGFAADLASLRGLYASMVGGTLSASTVAELVAEAVSDGSG